MEERATGLVLRTRPLTDTSLIVHWLTMEAGRLATVAKGARRAKSPFLGRLELHQAVHFSFRRARAGDLHVLAEADVIESFPRFAADYGLLCQAAYATSFVEQMTETDTPLDGLFDMVLGWLRHISSGAPRPRSVYAFELRLLDFLGLGPDWSGAGMAAEARELAWALTHASWEEVERLAPPADAVNLVRQRLHGFIIHHCQRLPRGRKEALAAGRA